MLLLPLAEGPIAAYAAGPPVVAAARLTPVASIAAVAATNASLLAVKQRQPLRLHGMHHAAIAAVTLHHALHCTALSAIALLTAVQYAKR